MNTQKLHHIGFIVASIPQVVERFACSISATWNGQIFYDPHQNVRVTFLQSEAPGEASIELVEPVDEHSPVNSFLKRGGGMHHLCYEVADLEAQLHFSRSQRCLIVKPPLPAVAFGGRRIAWVITPDKLLIEYLERE